MGRVLPRGNNSREAQTTLGNANFPVGTVRLLGVRREYERSRASVGFAGRLENRRS